MSLWKSYEIDWIYLDLLQNIVASLKQLEYSLPTGLYYILNRLDSLKQLDSSHPPPL
jgi:hypothetical protein